MNKVERVILRAAKEHGISMKELLGDSRRAEVVALRRAVAIKLIDDLKMTYVAAGRVLNRDPSGLCQLVGKART